MFRIEEIIKATGGKAKGKVPGAMHRVAGVSIDSRTLKKNELFIALKGERFDGHDFIQEAVRKGARGVIAERIPKNCIEGARVIIKVTDSVRALGDIAAWHRRRFNIPVAGITGSNGKTTVKEMTSSVLGKAHDILKHRGTENNLIGLPLTLLRLNRRHDAAVIEMGANHHGEIGRLTEILKPTMGLITNIGYSHLEFLKTRSGVLKAKSELAHRLRRQDMLFINGDDTMLTGIRTRANKITFGLKQRNDYHATNIRLGSSVSFVLNNSYPLMVKVPGMHNLYNTLASISLCRFFGMTIPEIREGLLDFRAPSGRTEFKTVKGFNIIDDAYNSNPLSVSQAIDTLSRLKTKGKRILVFGDMLELGAKTKYFHTTAGRAIAASPVTSLVTVGALSRSTIDAAKRAGMKKRDLWPCATTEEAAAVLKRIAGRKDLVLIKGSRGMRMEKVIERL